MYTPLDNKLIGQSIAKLRNHREIKAAEVAKYLHLSPAAYTKYEKGETAITIHFLNQMGEFFNVSPMYFLQSSPETIIENIHDNANLAINHSTLTTVDDKLLATLSEQIVSKDTQINRLTALLEMAFGKK